MTTTQTDKIIGVYGYIYGLYNRITKKQYIGQTTKDPYWYIRQNYELGKGKNRIKIARAIELYGWEAFDIALLDSAMNADELNSLETDYIKEYDSMNNGYNCDLGGRGHFSKLWWDSLTLEEYEEIRESKRGENNPMFGVPMSDYNKEKLLEANIGRPAWNRGSGLPCGPRWNKGLKLPPEYHDSQRGAKSPNWGKPGYNTGNKHTDETKSKEKERLAKLGIRSNNDKKVEVNGVIYVNKTAARSALNCSKSSFEKLNYKIIPKYK